MGNAEISLSDKLEMLSFCFGGPDMQPVLAMGEDSYSEAK